MNYLRELVEEFKNGMKKIYQDEIDFKDLDEADLTFCERFSNLLYNILLIIDYQKQLIWNNSPSKASISQSNQSSPERDTESEEEEMPKENKTLKLL